MRNVVQLAITLAASLVPLANAQTWVSTATKAVAPALNGAHELGALASSTPLHVVVGLKVRNAEQIQPTLRRMLTVGDPLYGTTLTVDQFVEQFAPTTTQVESVENYLSSYGFKNLSVSDNRLLVEADATAAQAESAFNTALASFSLNSKTIFANTADAQVPVALSGTVLAVLGLNNISALHPDIFRYTDPCTPPACPVPAA